MTDVSHSELLKRFNKSSRDLRDDTIALLARLETLLAEREEARRQTQEHITDKHRILREYEERVQQVKRSREAAVAERDAAREARDAALAERDAALSRNVAMAGVAEVPAGLHLRAALGAIKAHCAEPWARETYMREKLLAIAVGALGGVEATSMQELVTLLLAERDSARAADALTLKHAVRMQDQRDVAWRLISVLTESRDLAWDGLDRFIRTVEATGGLLRERDGSLAPAGDPDWLDLADAYVAACDAVGRAPVVKL